MRSVNIEELKDQLSKYVAFAQAGEVVVIREGGQPVAKLVGYATGEGVGVAVDERRDGTD